MIIYYIVQINISNLYLTIWYYQNAIKLHMYQYQDFFQANKSQSVEFLFYSRLFDPASNIFNLAYGSVKNIQTWVSKSLVKKKFDALTFIYPKNPDIGT